MADFHLVDLEPVLDALTTLDALLTDEAQAAIDFVMGGGSIAEIEAIEEMFGVSFE